MTELIETTEEEIQAPAKFRGRVGRTGVACLTSGALAVAFLLEIARNPDTIPAGRDFWIRTAPSIAWFDLAGVAVVVAAIAGILYGIDQRRQRTHYPRGFRASRDAGFSIPEILGLGMVVAYTAAVVAGPVWLGALIVQDQAPALAARIVDDLLLLPVTVGAYLYFLIVVPTCLFSFLLNRRHRRRYPDVRDQEPAGFKWTSRFLLVANVMTIVAVVLFASDVISV